MSQGDFSCMATRVIADHWFDRVGELHSMRQPPPLQRTRRSDQRLTAMGLQKRSEVARRERHEGYGEVTNNFELQLGQGENTCVSRY